MGGNAIDRQAAISALNNAENAMSQVPGKTANLIQKIIDLASVVRVENGTSMQSAYDNLNNNLGDFGVKIINTFPSLHEQMVDAINAAGAQTGNLVRLSSQSYGTCVGNPVPTYNDPGVSDYSQAQSHISEVATAFKEINATLNEGVGGYKVLYNVAQSSGYTELCDQAHSAAEEVRTLANTVNEFMQGFSNQFNDFVSTTRTKANTATSNAGSYISAIKSMTGSLQFTINAA